MSRIPSRVRFALPTLAGIALGACVAVAPPGGAAGRGTAVTGADGGTTVAASANEADSCEAACVPIECGDGTHPAPLSGECCPTTCESDDCSLVDCPPLDCASGTHAVKANGTCCATCARNPAPAPGDTCAAGQAGYADYVAQIQTSLGATFCQEDGDCRLVVIDNPCSHGCGTGVAARTALQYKSQLDDYAATHCGACASGSTSCPDTELVAFCTGGECTAH